ncbi:MAG: thiamine-phosphate kinase [Verrucomicrobia bacterium]|nr:thiamine-phosphate kinase [Verrucomicrobiota bacterium]MBI3869433.1 thiamine-phosphate kinase [Verrucomicrobiota bacterium]
MKEFELIQLLTRGLHTNAAVRLGPGDDCAVVDLGVPERQFLLKTDAVVEGVHFTSDTPPELIGRKALARNLSDVAAMAGRPIAALVTLGLPRGFKPSWVEAVYSGIDALARRFDTAIVGGETTSNPERALISVAVLGDVSRDAFIGRRGARPGDAVFVSGELGGSLQGRHLTFEPRLVEAAWLAENFRPGAMIDLSDGLAGDLRHLLKPDGLGVELLEKAIPISRAARVQAAAGQGAKPALLAALTDGEDFELLFTLSSKQAVALHDAWRKRFPETRLSCIGRISSKPGVLLRGPRGVRELQDHGYVHFQQP